MSNKNKNDLGTFLSKDIEKRFKRRRKELKEKLENGWGNWRFDSQDKILIISKSLEDGPVQDLYEIYLEECNTSAQILDWIAQVSQKTWVSREDVGNLVEALDDLFQLQGAFCGSGIEQSDGRNDYAKSRLDSLIKYVRDES